MDLNNVSKFLAFDFDGVIFNPTRLMIEAYNHAIAKIIGRPVDKSQLLPLLRNSPFKVLKHFVPDSYRQAYSFYDAYFTKHTHEVTECDLYPSMKEILHKLDKKYALGLVTSQTRKRLSGLLRAFEIRYLFSVIIAYNDVPRGKKKPNPYPIHLAMQWAEIPENQMVYIGDAPSDIQAAKRAGVTSVGVTWGLYEVSVISYEEPDYLIENPEELLGIFRNSSHHIDASENHIYVW